MLTIKDALITTTHKLTALYEPSHAHMVALWLLEKVTGKSPALLMVHQTSELSASDHEKLMTMLSRLIDQKYPLQYLLGSVPFGSIDIICKEPVLIPRPETEHWVTELIEYLAPFADQPLTILDMCTGSGCIGLALAHAFKNSTVHAVDNTPQALELAHDNAAHNDITNFIVHSSDGFTQLAPSLRFDLIVSNPPYIDQELYKTLEPVVKDWEDRNALVADNDGLALYERFAVDIPAWLKKDSIIPSDYSRIVMEIGSDQGLSVSELFKAAGFTHVAVKKDQYEKDRTVWAAAADRY